MKRLIRAGVRRWNALARTASLRTCQLLRRPHLETTILAPDRFHDFLIHVKPADVVWCVGTPSVPDSKRFISGGDWDIDGVAKVEEQRPVTAETIEQLFVEGRDFRRTTQYEVMRAAVEKYLRGECERPDRIGAYWCRSLEDIDRYFAILMEAYQDIKVNGYKTQAQIALEKSGHVRKAHDEVRVYIGRDGQFMLGRGGTHRLMIARVLDLESIPVVLAGVHRKWALAAFESANDGSKYVSVERAIRVAAERAGAPDAAGSSAAEMLSAMNGSDSRRSMMESGRYTSADS